MKFTKDEHLRFITKHVKEFLSQRRESDGGWAKITDEDLDVLSRIIDLLVKAKCEPDPDGDYPIDWKLINRRIHEPIHFVPVPYSHKDPRGFIEAATRNLNIACGKMDTIRFELSLLLKKKGET